jgi:hypothetical protein
MRHALLTTLATLAAISTAACSEAASEPTAVYTEALVATAADWTPADLTHDLPVDAATQQRIDAGIQAMHTSMLELHERHATAGTLEGVARDAYLADLAADMQALHAQHRALWDSLDPAVQETLASRFHEQMRDHHGDDDAMSLHDRMRRMHGGDHAPDNAGH